MLRHHPAGCRLVRRHGGARQDCRLADSRGVLVIPHGSSVYSYHFVITRHNSPFAEFLMMAPKADKVVPMFSPQLLGEPVPENGRIKLSALDKPGFGVELNREVKLHRPYPR